MSDYGIFAGPSSPQAPVANKTMWFDMVAGVLKIWTGTQWDTFQQYHVDMAVPSEGGTGIDTSGSTGLLLARAGAYSVVDWFVSVDAFGASTGGSAAANTTAFNSALADGRPVFVPGETYTLNALAPVTSPRTLFGAGRRSKLVFNTTGNGIVLNPASSDQSDVWHIHDLSFGNITNVPAAFVVVKGALNSKLERLYFDHCAATYCIDNENGYGTTIRDCTFSDVTGSGVRLQDDGQVTKYSYMLTLANNDFTRCSVSGIDVDGCQCLNILGGVIESCGIGLHTNYRVASQAVGIVSWNVNLMGVYFESNNTDIDLEGSGGTYWGRATLIGCVMVGTPTINLHAWSKIVLIGCNTGGGGHVCTISGSGSASAALWQCENGLFTQSGSFYWTMLDQYWAMFSHLEGANPGAGTKRLWYDPADGNRVKFSA